MNSPIAIGCITAVLLAGLGGNAAAAPGQVRDYSNICYNTESGDILGTEIGLVDMGREMYVTYRVTDGGFVSISVAELTLDDYKKAKAGSLEFESADARAPGTYRGRITDREIVLTAGGMTNTGDYNDKDHSPIHLKRVKLPFYYPDCH